ncbi:hypothetical protein EXM65_12970 [Clostridium botulinum]|uniref:Butirosin biosynthesis protein H N-terminal domain-containing protein n=1 Tax=Clostridium botulinum TaxID=1491 RepID=A0A6M0SQ84_CLOBO|nr:hypothetical protein [Clostridium botulinum]
MKIIKVKLENELLNIDSVNCLEISIAYCLNKIGIDYKQYFILYLKCLQSYKIKKYSGLNVKYPVEIHYFLKDILKKLNVEIIQNKNLCNSSIFIKNSINDNDFVFISGNLKELYYSKYYKKEDSRHVFLINGYDEGRNIYYIIDNIQNQNSRSEYSQFSIKKSMLEKMISSYQTAFQTFFECKIKMICPQLNKKKILKEVLSHICQSNTELWENDFIDDIKNIIDGNSRENECVEECFIRCIKHKYLFYKTLLNIIKNNFPNIINYEIFEKTYEELIQTWKSISNICLFKLYKKEHFDITIKVREAIMIENYMKEILKHIILEIGGE